jgi:hypothetical protein
LEFVSVSSPSYELTFVANEDYGKIDKYAIDIIPGADV